MEGVGYDYCCYKEREIAGSAEILSPVNIYSYEITLSGKEKKNHNKETVLICVEL